MFQRLLNIPKRQHFLLLGARQTGKTTLVRELFREMDGKTHYINLAEEEQFFKYIKEPSRLRDEIAKDLDSGKLEQVCIDEVQRVPMLLNEVQVLIDNYQARFILTGSSARKLKHGGANLLGGRAVVRYLFPLTAYELGDSFDLEKTLRFGSLPRVWQAETDQERFDLLDAYTKLYLKEEVQTEGLVRNLPAFSRFLDVAAQNSGELLNYSSIGHDVGLPGRTVQTYYDILEETLIAFRLQPFERSVRRRLCRHSKIYLFDTGVLNALQQTITAAHAPILRGKLFEHWMILESQRMLSYSRAEMSTCFWRTKDDEEVDLVFTKSGEPLLACEFKSSTTITALALRGLRAFNSEHPQTECVVAAPIKRSFNLEGFDVLSVEDYLKRVADLTSPA